MAAVGAARRSARPTELADTPVRCAIAAWESPSPRSPTISATLSSVSLDGPFGPIATAASPTTPVSACACRHRHTVVSFTPNAAATCRCDAARTATSPAAASRRPQTSPAAHVHAAIPARNTTPPSTASSSRSTPGATCTDPPGASGNGGPHGPPSLVIPIPDHPPGTLGSSAFIIADRGRDKWEAQPLDQDFLPPTPPLPQEVWTRGGARRTPTAAG